MSAVSSGQLAEDPAVTTDAVIGHMRGIRGWLRFFAVTALIFTLWIAAYGGAMVLDVAGLAAGLGRSAGFITITVAMAMLLPAALLWRQADALSRFIAAPSDALFAVFTREMRRFWRVSAGVAMCVFLVTVVSWVLLLVLEH